MMFYNGFNLMIDAILVASTAIYVSWKTKRNIDMDYAYHTRMELDYEYNEGWEAGYEAAIRDKERNTMFLNYDNHKMKDKR